MSPPVVVGLWFAVAEFCGKVRRGEVGEAISSSALLTGVNPDTCESRHKQGAVKHFDSFRKRPIHSNQGKQLQRRKFTSLLRFQRKKKKKKSLGLRRSVTVCQHINRALGPFFLPPFYSSFLPV